MLQGLAEGETLFKHLLEFGVGGVLGALIFYYSRKDAQANQATLVTAEKTHATKIEELTTAHANQIQALAQAHANQMQTLTQAHAQALQQTNEVWAERMKGTYEQLHSVAADYKDILVSTTRAITALHQFLLNGALSEEEKEG